MQSVTVIVPAFNAAGFITPAIRSALDQEGVAVDVVVADDCSSDALEPVLAALGDPRVSYLRLAANAGPAGARNAALARATGDWVAVLDADDEFLPGRLAHLIGLAEAQGADIVSDNVWLKGQDGAPSALFLAEALDGTLQTFDAAGFALTNLMFTSPRPTGYFKPVFQRRFLDAHGLVYEPTLRIGEDFDLILRALLAGGRYVRSRTAGYAYTTREGSISAVLHVAQLRTMIAADRRILSGAAMNAADRAAIARHLDVLLDAEAYLEMVEALKARRVAGFLGVLARRPAAALFLRQPVMARLRRFGRARGPGHERPWEAG